MSNRQIIIIALTLVVVIAAVIVSQQRAPQTSKEKTILFPELAERINDVNELVIRDDQNTLTILRAAGSWSIAEADNYPALIDKVKQTVLAVSDLQVISEKTNNPDLYKRLGVEDPDSQGATSHWLTLSGNGDELASLIVGKSRRSKSAAGAPGLYVRVPGQQQALLVEGRLSASADIIQWIRRDIINIEGERVNSVQLRPADRREVVLKRDNPADDLALQDIPEGKEQQSDYLISRMAALLENVYVDGVRKEKNLDFTRPESITNITMFDGLTAHVEVVKSDEHSYARFSFAAQADRPDNKETTGETSPETDAEEEIKPTPEQEAETLNSLVQGWAYRLSTSKAELFNQSLSDLVRDPVSDTTEDTE